MTAYLVDTNLPSELTKPSPDPHVAAFLIGAGRESTYVSVVTIGEICRASQAFLKAAGGTNFKLGWTS